ncbi:MAG: efflux RND transporter periplasmic adaptor subunit [Caulobacteraceae bacterium]
MRLKPAYAVVISIVAVVFVYLLVRPLLGHGAKSDANAAGRSVATATVPLVRTQATPEARHTYTVTFRGRTQAARTVVVRSETAGPVAATPVMQGRFVRAGTVLCRLAVDARQAALDQARAALRAKQLQLQASANLAAKGFRSRTQVLTDQAEMDAASAAVRQGEVALRQVELVAPFAGVFDHRDAEVGAYLAPGQACGTVIELDPLLIVGDVPETEIARLRVGAAATATLVSGETVAGRVRFVARDADPATRTYRVEVTAANPGDTIQSGLSAQVSIATGIGPAHLVPVSALVLDSAGRQGVRYVQPGGAVAFAPVTVMESTPTGVWVSGLHGPVRVITVGQSYVSEGQKVRTATAPSDPPG